MFKVFRIFGSDYSSNNKAISGFGDQRSGYWAPFVGIIGTRTQDRGAQNPGGKVPILRSSISNSDVRTDASVGSIGPNVGLFRP